MTGLQCSSASSSFHYPRFKHPPDPILFHYNYNRNPKTFRRVIKIFPRPLIVYARDAAGAGGASAPSESEPFVLAEKSTPSPHFQVCHGCPTPFGATPGQGGVNFSVFSSNATSAILCFFSFSDLPQKRVTKQISLDPKTNKTGDVWHVFVKGNLKGMLYGYKFDGKFSPEEGHYFDSTQILLDPYCKAVASRGEFGVLAPGDDCWPQMACEVPSADDEFDWEGDLPLKHQQKDLVIYEMHVRGFTNHESSMTQCPGSYLGVVEKLDHLKELGFNCIELLPCHEFNELEYYSYNSVLGDYSMFTTYCSKKNFKAL